MLHAIALDDDRSALTTLDAYCQRTAGVTLYRTFTQQHQAQLYLQHNRVNLVFAETRLAGGSGIEFWQSVCRWAIDKQTPLPELVFVTQHSEYAVLSYELQTLDYLLKPVSLERFSRTIQKANDQLTSRPPLPRPALHRCFRVDYGHLTVDLAEITCIEALGNYCKLYLVDQRPLVIRSTMKALLHELPPVAFMQVHRSYIVAKEYIRTVRNKQICVADKQVPVGTRYERILCHHLASLAYSSQL